VAATSFTQHRLGPDGVEFDVPGVLDHLRAVGDQYPGARLPFLAPPVIDQFVASDADQPGGVQLGVDTAADQGGGG